MARFRPHAAALAAVNTERYIIVPCEADGCADLAVIWDRLEEQVVDVVSAAASAFYSDDDALWDEGRGAREVETEWRMAA
jgi:hypothetical protein